MEHNFQDAMDQNNLVKDNKFSFENLKSGSDATKDLDDNSSSGFDCNICLDSVNDPVVTLCGHLYCWPCIYKWLNFQSNQDHHQQPCPVCKAEVSQASLVPLYGKGQTTKPSKSSKAPNLGIVIPRRPVGVACGFDSPRASSTNTSPHITQQLHYRNFPHRQQLNHPVRGGYPASSQMITPGGTTTTHVYDPTVGVFGEMVYARVFGNSITNLYSHPNSYNRSWSNSPRLRRHVMQADRSLNRICFFLFCCLVSCLVLF